MRLPLVEKTYLMPFVYRVVLLYGGLLFMALALTGTVADFVFPEWVMRSVYFLSGAAIIRASISPEQINVRWASTFAGLVGGVFRWWELVDRGWRVNNQSNPTVGGFAWLFVGVVVAAMSAYGWVYHNTDDETLQ